MKKRLAFLCFAVFVCFPMAHSAKASEPANAADDDDAVAADAEPIADAAVVVDTGPAAAATVLANTAAYDGKNIAVIGTVSHLRHKTAKRGYNYTTFTLLGENALSGISVYSRGTFPIADGQRVTVFGVFKRNCSAKGAVFDEIDATKIK